MAQELYITLAKEASAEFEEKRSLFIGYAKPTRTEEQALDFITQIKQKHKDATHNVFGYSMKHGILARYSDDGEPQGTAGMPVLDVIRKSGVDDATVVVTRYFGGILLGAGGLVRAYAAAAKMALDAAEIVAYESYTELALTCSYADHQRLTAELPRFGAILDDTVYADNVTLKFAVKDAVADPILARIREMSGGKLTPTILGHRFDYQA
ncbi:MAG: YigZ family protein [Clostridia bacterium]|nr:YigZ family protein [Clostridia bacterium]